MDWWFVLSDYSGLLNRLAQGNFRWMYFVPDKSGFEWIRVNSLYCIIFAISGFLYGKLPRTSCFFRQHYFTVNTTGTRRAQHESRDLWEKWWLKCDNNEHIGRRWRHEDIISAWKAHLSLTGCQTHGYIWNGFTGGWRLTLQSCWMSIALKRTGTSCRTTHRTVLQQQC